MTDWQQHGIDELLEGEARGEVGARGVLEGRVRGCLLEVLADSGEAPERDAVVNRAWTELVGARPDSYRHRSAFLRIAARSLRTLIADRARRRAAAPSAMGTGGARPGEPVSRGATPSSASAPSTLDAGRSNLDVEDARALEGMAAVQPLEGDELLAFDAALDELDRDDPQLTSLVELLVFAGVRVHEVAEVHGLARQDVPHLWRLARARLHRSMGRPGVRRAGLG